MIADPPQPTETVVVRSAVLPPSPADAAFSIIRLDTATLRAGPRLDEALANIPGFSLFRRTSSLGANPTTQGVSLRGIAGSGASRALVILDGVPQNDPFGGWVIWTRLPTEDIGAASIVRGAGAGPYGAGALTGVVALRETTPDPGAWSLGATFGSLGLAKGAATADLPLGPGSLTIVAAGEHSDGWIPVVLGRGAADQRLTLDDRTVSARYQFDAGATTHALRGSVYEEDRSSGLAGAASRSRGASFSLSSARAPTFDALGWRAQAWVLGSDLANTSVSVASGRQTTALSNNQYETPAIGYGANMAVRRVWPKGTLELGLDIRGAAGEDRETFRPLAGVLTKRRLTGGETLTGGVYGEATRQDGPLLLTAGARVDGWSTFDSHRLESVIATGASTLDLHPGARGGVLPSGRLGACLDIGGDEWLRAAAYTGFRAPTLNELFRPFRVGNNVTEANATLTPERLYGVEAGGGGALLGRGTWSVTMFYNRLENPVTNVTLGKGPFIDPVAGLIPAGGLLLQRRNLGAVNAFGLEAEAAVNFTHTARFDAALSWTHARVATGAAAPRLNGLVPAETPDISANARLSWRLHPKLTLAAETRYQGERFDDDQNTRRLSAAATTDFRVEWRPKRNVTVFLAAANLADERVSTGETADGIFSYGPPLTVSAGFSIRGGGR